VLEAWIARFGLEFRWIKSSGHSRPEDIARMVAAVRPKLVLPVHSAAPENLVVPGVPSFLPQAGLTYRVTDLLASVGVRPALRADGGAIQPAWLIADSRDALLAGAATALHAQLVDHTPDRLGTCSGHRCADVYIDASPAGDRRFCSVTCQTRTRVAAFRGRKATAR
jgi:hypothetical protein